MAALRQVGSKVPVAASNLVLSSATAISGGQKSPWRRPHTSHPPQSVGIKALPTVPTLSGTQPDQHRRIPSVDSGLHRVGLGVSPATISLLITPVSGAAARQ